MTDYESVLRQCVLRAIRQFGLENYKKTSLFMSSRKGVSRD